MARILWEVGSLVPMLIGIMHLIGTLFTELLHPKNKKLMEEMKYTPIVVDDKVSIWKAWIGFNATFSICLFLMGFINFYLAYSYFEILKGFSILSISSLSCLVLLILLSHKYSIRKVRTIFLITFIFYILSVIIGIQ